MFNEETSEQLDIVPMQIRVRVYQSQCAVAVIRPVATGHRSCISHSKSRLTSAHNKCMQGMEQVLDNFSSGYICVSLR
ncbi:hypothetical protein PflCFBP13510_04650 [Pseudomonas fluorescens]|nr:hypothetical protein PflCFBP13510_04650 [Pseudomonas fluorescens]